MNVKPKLVPADFKMPPPKPRREKRIIESGNKQPKKLEEKKEPQLPIGKPVEMKEPQSPSGKVKKKKGKKKRKGVKGFVEAKSSLNDMSNLYGNLE